MALSEAQIEQRRNAGRKGGEATRDKHGAGHYSDIGKLSGPPTWQQKLDRAWADERQRIEDARIRSRPGPRSAS